MSDGTNSKVFYTPNVFASTFSWSATSAISGIYDQLRITGNAGQVAIYTPGGVAGDSDYDFNFLTSDEGFTANAGMGYDVANWVLGTGWYANGSDATHRTVDISKALVDTVTKVEVTFWVDVNTGGTSAETIQINGSTAASGGNPPAGTNTLTFVGSTAATSIGAVINSDSTSLSAVAIQRMKVWTGAIGDAQACYSTDNGATFGGAVNIGSPVPSAIGGFDVQRLGTVSIAAMALKTRKATTWGGAFSDDQTWTANPRCVVLPWYTRNSTSALNSGSSPEYIVGLDAADGSGNTLYWVVGGTPVDITPEIGGVAGIVVSADALTTWKGKYIAGLFNFSGVTHLMVSIDGGSNWTDRGVVDATYLRLRRLANTPGQLYAAGATLKYSATFGNSLAAKTKPSSADLVFIEAYG